MSTWWARFTGRSRAPSARKVWGNSPYQSWAVRLEATIIQTAWWRSQMNLKSYATRAGEHSRMPKGCTVTKSGVQVAAQAGLPGAVGVAAVEVLEQGAGLD